MCRINPRVDFAFKKLFGSEVESIRRSGEILDEMSLSNEERESYEARLKWLRDEEAALKTAENKGFRRGREEGIIQEKIGIAKKLLKNNVDMLVIKQSTGLRIEDIEKIVINDNSSKANY